jgi:hypothetical protein
VNKAKSNSEFMALDIDSGDYCVNAEELSALRGLRSRQPNARVYFARVGAPFVYEMRYGRVTANSMTS